MKIVKNTVVELTYELIVDGEVVESVKAEKPFDYVHGNNMLIPGFEAAVDGKEPGDSFAFTLAPADAYGEYDETRLITLPKEAFIVNGEVREDLLVVGQYIPMVNSEGGIEQARIAEVKEDSVVMDFNAPMAGKTLNFSGVIISVREATEKELTEGLHGEFLPKEHHCGGNCGGCGGGCCGGHSEEEGHECHCGGHGSEEGHECKCGGHGSEEGHECKCGGHGSEEGHECHCKEN